MLIVADTHVHVYRGYDVAAALGYGIKNISKLAHRSVEAIELADAPASDETLLVLFLAEAEGCHFFKDLVGGGMKDQLPGWSAQAAAEEGAARVVGPEPTAKSLLLVAGRQVVTKERLEVLALATTHRFPRGLSLEQATTAVREAGGVPVLSWAPGKWSFQRGERVAAMIDGGSPHQLLIGDSSLRARREEPRLMRRARALGFKVIAGSDPLPIGGEERLLGSYGSFWQGEVEMERPLVSLRTMLLDPAVPATQVGDRSSMLGVASRLGRHTLAKKLGTRKRGRSDG